MFGWIYYKGGFGLFESFEWGRFGIGSGIGIRVIYFFLREIISVRYYWEVCLIDEDNIYVNFLDIKLFW